MKPAGPLGASVVGAGAFARGPPANGEPGVVPDVIGVTEGDKPPGDVTDVVDVSAATTARNVCASRVASAFLRCTTCTFPDSIVGWSSCSINAFACAARNSVD